jgi:hypothetical protein
MIIPGSANPLLLASAAAAGGLQVSRSLRFNSPDSAYLSRTNGNTASTYTLALWVKRSSLNTSGGDPQYLFSSGNAGLAFSDANAIYIWNGASAITSLGVYRDISAWYHVVLSVYSGAGTIYVNNQSVASGSTASLSSSSNATNIGRYWNSGTGLYYFSGYLANIHFIDGQALTPASFAETDAITGQWIPKAFSGGSYGTNGFYLRFNDNSTTAALGTDSSGNGNTWTTNNFSVTAGAGNDSLIDSPTNYGTDTGVGGEVRGNYATWNPLQSSSSTLANGNLDCTTSVATGAQVRATIAVSSSKWYWEVTVNTSVTANNIGIIKTSEALVADRPGYFAGGYAYVGYSGNKENNASASAYGATYGSGDVIGVALDLTAGTLVFYKNGTSQGTAYSSLSGEFIPCIGDGTGGSGLDMITNFGQRAFAYTAPSGFKALCTQNLPAPLVTKSNEVFDVVKYDGNNSTQSITSLAFEPDFVWSKCRNVGRSHRLNDAVRGSTKELYSDATSSEFSDGSIVAFTSNGFNLDNATGSTYNTSGETYVSWCWDAGTSTVSNTQGSITGGAQVRANPTAGFSVVTYTGNGTSGATVGHGLNVAPSMLIVKKRSSAGSWEVYLKDLGPSYYLELERTNAKGGPYSGLWNDTAPTSAVFSIGNDGGVNTNGSTYVCYAFAPVVGFSSFGSYTGNGSSDGPFVYTGHRSRFLMVKRTDTSGDWYIVDTARSTSGGGNVIDQKLYPNLYVAENGGSGETTSTNNFDILSNGFKCRTTNGNTNASGGTYVWAAFAEAPFNYSRAR